jgi:Anti-sigma factor NepR
MLGSSTPHAASTGGGSRRGPGARKQDWIGNQLRMVYDQALSEDIPPEMLALLDQLDEGGDPERDAAPSDDDPESRK